MHFKLYLELVLNEPIDRSVEVWIGGQIMNNIRFTDDTLKITARQLKILVTNGAIFF